MKEIREVRMVKNIVCWYRSIETGNIDFAEKKDNIEK